MSVSVVIPTHDQQRWDSLIRTVASVSAQLVQPDEIMVVVDHNPTLLSRARKQLPGVTVLENEYTGGASGTRNTGAAYAGTEFVAFLDDDTTADPRWLGRILLAFTDPDVVGAGGGIEGAWQLPRPRWMPAEFLWTVGISYAGMPTTTAPVRNVWSANMVVRREAFQAVGGFRDGFGKRGDENRPEDTDLCLRMSTNTGAVWMYVPEAMIHHEIPVGRSTFGFFLRRCYAEGRGKVQIAELLSGSRELAAERDYLRRTVPRAIGRDLAEAGRGRGAAYAMRAAAALAAVVSAGVGAVTQSLLRLSARALLPPRKAGPARTVDDSAS